MADPLDDIFGPRSEGAVTTPTLIGSPSAPSDDWPLALKSHLSASQVNSWSRCENQTRFAHVLGIKSRPGIALVWGGADHVAIGESFRQKIETEKDLPVSEVQELFVAALESKIAAEEDEIDWGSGEYELTPAKVKDDGVLLVAAYQTKASPAIHPIAVEQDFTVDLGAQVPVTGFIDVVTETNVIERKTASRLGPPSAPEYRAQALLYAAATGKPAEIHMSVKPQKTNPARIITSEQDPELSVTPDLVRAELLVKQTADGILNALATYGVDSPWPGARYRYGSNSPCKWCGYGPAGSNICEWWA